MTWEWIVIILLFLAIGSLDRSVKQLKKENDELLSRVYNLEDLLVGSGGFITVNKLLEKKYEEDNFDSFLFQMKEVQIDSQRHEKIIPELEEKIEKLVNATYGNEKNLEFYQNKDWPLYKLVKGQDREILRMQYGEDSKFVEETIKTYHA